MGFELARMFVGVRGDTSQLEPDLRQAQGIVKSVFADVRSYALGVLGPIASMGGAFLDAGSKMGIEGEKTRVKFETMIGSVEETEATLKRLTAFAAATPFEMPQLKQVTEGLIQFGERGDELFETLKILGDASGGTAQDFGTLGLVYNQVRGVGKLLTQDFRQLSTRGILSLTDIAKHYKVPTDEAQKMLSTGRITFEELRVILKGMTEEGGRMANMMEKQSQTMDGLMSTYSDAVNILGSKVAGVTDAASKNILRFKIAFVEAVDAAVTESDGFVASAMVGSVWAAKFGVALMGTGLAAKFLGLSLRKAIIGTGIGAVFLAAGAALGLFANLMMKNANAGIYLEEIFGNLKKVWNTLIEAAVKIGKAVMEMFGSDFDGMTDDVWGFFIALSDNFVAMAEWVNEAADDILYYFRNAWKLSKVALIDFVLFFAEKIGLTDGMLNTMAGLLVGMWAGAKSAMLSFFEIGKFGFQSLIRVQEFMYSTAMSAMEKMIAFTGYHFQAVKAALSGNFELSKTLQLKAAAEMVSLVEEIKAIPQGLQQALTGIDKDKLMAEMRAYADSLKAKGLRPEEIEKRLKKWLMAKQKEMVPDLDIAGNARKAALAAFNSTVASMAGLDGGGPLALLKSERDKLMDEVDQAEQDRINAAAPWEGPVLPDDKKDDEKEAPPVFELKMEAGRFGFADFGRSLQDSILKDKDDQAAKMLAATEQGVDIQAQLLEEAKKNKPAALAK